MRITIKQLQIFQAVAYHLNYKRAADELYISQPAVSKQIQILESTLGCTLFEKLGKHSSLTERGKILKSKVDNFLQQFDELKNDIQHSVSEATKLSIATTTPMEDIVVDSIAELVKANPELKVNLSVLDNHQIFDAIVAKSHDIYINQHLDKIDDHCQNHLFDADVKLIANAGHRLNGQPDLTESDLSGESLIEFPYTNEFKKFVDEFKTKYVIDNCDKMKVFGRAALYKSIDAGIGLAFMAEFKVKKHIDSGRFCALNIKESPQVSYFYTHHKNKILIPEAISFINKLKSKTRMM